MWQWVLGIAVALLVLWGVVALLVWLFGVHPVAPFALISMLAWWPTFVRARATRDPAPIFIHFAVFAIVLMGVWLWLREPLIVGDLVLDILLLGWFLFACLAAAAATGWRDPLPRRVQTIAAGIAVASVCVTAAYHYVAFPRGPQTPPVWTSASNMAAPAITPAMREIGFDSVAVVVALYVDRSGRPRYARVVDNPSGDDTVADAALNAVKRSRFSSVAPDGERGYWANVSVRFDLN